MLKDFGRNDLVAMSLVNLSDNLEEWCGKTMRVTATGGPKAGTVVELILWDACARCSTDNGLDMSSDTYVQLFGADNCGSVTEMTWELLNETNAGFVYNNGEPESGPRVSGAISNKMLYRSDWSLLFALLTLAFALGLC
jgi:hypothetical protein